MFKSTDGIYLNKLVTFSSNADLHNMMCYPHDEYVVMFSL